MPPSVTAMQASASGMLGLSMHGGGGASRADKPKSRGAQAQARANAKRPALSLRYGNSSSGMQ